MRKWHSKMEVLAWEGRDEVELHGRKAESRSGRKTWVMRWAACATLHVSGTMELLCYGADFPSTPPFAMYYSSPGGWMHVQFGSLRAPDCCSAACTAETPPRASRSPLAPFTSHAIPQSFGNRPRRLRSYTTSSTSFTLYLMPSLRFRRESFLRFRIWNPAKTSLMN